MHVSIESPLIHDTTTYAEGQDILRAKVVLVLRHALECENTHTNSHPGCGSISDEDVQFSKWARKGLLPQFRVDQVAQYVLARAQFLQEHLSLEAQIKAVHNLVCSFRAFYQQM